MKTDPMTPIDRLRNDNSVVYHFLCVCLCECVRYEAIEVVFFRFLLLLFYYTFLFTHSSAISISFFQSLNVCLRNVFFVPFSMKPIDIARGADDTLFQKKRTDAAATALTTSLQILSALDLFLLITLYNSWKQTVHVLHDEQ